MERTEHELVSAAQIEVVRMREAVASAGADSRVTMSARQFGAIAELLAGLCDLVPAQDPEGFAADSQWVPLAEYQRLRRLFAKRQSEFNDLRLRQDVEALIAGDRPMEWVPPMTSEDGDLHA